MNSQSHLLLIEKSPRLIKELALILEHEGYNLSFSVDLLQAQRLLAEEHFDLILIDHDTVQAELPGLCTRIRKNNQGYQIPILVISDQTQSPDLEQILNLDANDHIQLQFHPTELRRRIRNLLELKDTKEALSQVKEELEFTQEHLNSVLDQLENVSRNDLLTGLYNRKQALDRIEEECARCLRTKRNFAILLCDLDQFHKVNDELGNDVGDFVLRALANYFRNAVRRQDSVARWAGEEFIFVLPETDALGAKILAEKIRQKLLSFTLSYGNHKLNVQCSFAFHAYELEQSLNCNLKKLDQTLMQAKSLGGAQILGSHQIPKSELLAY